MDRLKVLFHINDNERWQKILSNVNNFIKDVGRDNADIELVAHAGAAAVFNESCQITGNNGAACGEIKGKIKDEMQRLADLGVNFVTCRNSLKAHEIEEDKLPSFVKVVPAAVTHIVKKQTEGYAYFKA